MPLLESYRVLLLGTTVILLGASMLQSEGRMDWELDRWIGSSSVTGHTVTVMRQLT